jgi:hypothetical protein
VNKCIQIYFKEVFGEEINLGVFEPNNPAKLAKPIKVMIDCWALRYCREEIILALCN